MLPSMYVPAGVPLVTQGSRPLVLSVAAKKTFPPNAVKPAGVEPSPWPQRLQVSGMAQMSFRRNVPAAVPSLFHGSGPTFPSSALKYRAPWASVALVIDDERWLLMFFTIVVPTPVPLLFQSSRPPPWYEE